MINQARDAGSAPGVAGGAVSSAAHTADDSGFKPKK